MRVYLNMRRFFVLEGYQKPYYLFEPCDMSGGVTALYQQNQMCDYSGEPLADDLCLFDQDRFFSTFVFELYNTGFIWLLKY